MKLSTVACGRDLGSFENGAPEVQYIDLDLRLPES